MLGGQLPCALSLILPLSFLDISRIRPGYFPPLASPNTKWNPLSGQHFDELWMGPFSNFLSLDENALQPIKI